MSPLSSRSGGSGQEVVLIQRLMVGGVVVVVGFLLGRLIPENAFLPIALVVGFGLVFLLLKKPSWFVLMGIFFFYGALKIVDTEVVGRVAGLFRLKDVFLLMMVLHIVATHAISRRHGVLPGKAPAFRMFLLFMAWIGFQMWRSTFLLDEEPMLMFRVGRHFLTYGFFIFILYYLQREEDWKLLKRYMHGLAILTVFLGLLTALGLSITVYPRGSMPVGQYYYGIYKFSNPGESLVFALFMYNVWRFCFRPTWRAGLMAALMAGGCTIFIYRARLAGAVFGMIVSAFFAPPRVRRRAILMGVTVAFSALIMLSLFGLVAASVTEMGQESYLGNLAEYFNEAARGVLHRDTEDVYIRQFFVKTRWSLVEKHPLAGLGFVSPFGRVAWNMFRLGDLPIGHVDVGWLDALMLLGGIGTLILAVFLISAALEGKSLLSIKNLSEEDHAFGLSMVAFVVLMFVSTYSFAYPTREESILTFSLLFAWLMHARRKAMGFVTEGDGKQELPAKTRQLSAGRIPGRKIG